MLLIYKNCDRFSNGILGTEELFSGKEEVEAAGYGLPIDLRTCGERRSWFSCL